MLFYSATLDVPKSTARTVSAWIQAHRKKNDQRPWQRAASCWKQTIMLLRWLKDGTNITTIARDAKVSPATGYRYIHEALDVVAEKITHPDRSTDPGKLIHIPYWSNMVEIKPAIL